MSSIPRMNPEFGCYGDSFEVGSRIKINGHVLEVLKIFEDSVSDPMEKLEYLVHLKKNDGSIVVGVLPANGCWYPARSWKDLRELYIHKDTGQKMGSLKHQTRKAHVCTEKLGDNGEVIAIIDEYDVY